MEKRKREKLDPQPIKRNEMEMLAEYQTYTIVK